MYMTVSCNASFFLTSFLFSVNFQIEKEAKAVATFMEAAYFNNSGAVQGVVVLTQEVNKSTFT